jgi:hypothetical protein
MSALPPKADMCGATRDVRFGLIADIFTEFRSRLKRIGTVGGSPVRSLFTPPRQVGCYLEPIVSDWLQTRLS